MRSKGNPTVKIEGEGVCSAISTYTVKIQIFHQMLMSSLTLFLINFISSTMSLCSIQVGPQNAPSSRQLRKPRSPQFRSSTQFRTFSKLKYTNSACGILDFCKQKYFRPILCIQCTLCSRVADESHVQISSTSIRKTCFFTVLRNVRVYPNPVTISYCYADYSVGHLNNENNETTKHVQTLKSTPLREGPNWVESQIKQKTKGIG